MQLRTILYAKSSTPNLGFHRIALLEKYLAPGPLTYFLADADGQLVSIPACDLGAYIGEYQLAPPVEPTFDQSAIDEIEKQLICDQLVLHNGNQRRVAEALRMPKSTLHDRIRHYGIDIRALLETRSR